jgi:hypothetical protein
LLEGIGLVSIEVGDSCSWHQDGRITHVVADSKHILVWHELGSLDTPLLLGQTVLHVGSLLFLRNGVLPNLHLIAEAQRYESGVGDVAGGGWRGREVVVQAFVGVADVPNLEP